MYITIVLLSYESYYYCNEKGCLTFVETQKGRDTVIKIYDKRIYSRLQMKNAPYMELYPEYLAYFEESDSGLFIVRSNFYPQVTKGKMNNIQFVISDYECCGALYSDLNFYMIVF
ncbi:hypothetical protein M2R47_06220 [Moraxella sp. Tifton1]|uniref:Uncharacterized protein n=1 Tax=Moraxella oculi TaxID=2940516 RepID=A0ABW8UCD7_9GAMM|nr:hypothetical protein [Moraxella sp. Tifton1]MCL1623834.1 hypothetical protein [Moraxella sp. Tifton1]